jgi:hypothetical protein
MVYSRKRSLTAKFSDMIDGKSTLSGEFNFTRPHTLTATTWMQPGSVGDKNLDKVGDNPLSYRVTSAGEYDGKLSLGDAQQTKPATGMTVNFLSTLDLRQSGGRGTRG